MKQQIKSFIISLISLKQYLQITGWRHKEFKTGQNAINTDFFFKLLSKKSKPVSFIQIGANDGVKNDPIYAYIKEHHWKGILVEPLPQLFKKLKDNYKGEANLVFENVGISDQNGEMDFYYLDASYNEPDWLQQIGTFDRHAIEFNLESYPQLINKITTQKIQAVTLKELIKRNNISEIDLLIIDAEGFEHKILGHLDTIDIKPSYIFFEWGCMTNETMEKLFAFLTDQEYKLYSCGGDVLAVNKQA